jgi:hypothetical protein
MKNNIDINEKNEKSIKRELLYSDINDNKSNIGVNTTTLVYTTRRILPIN